MQYKDFVMGSIHSITYLKDWGYVVLVLLKLHREEKIISSYLCLSPFCPVQCPSFSKLLNR